MMQVQKAGLRGMVRRKYGKQMKAYDNYKAAASEVKRLYEDHVLQRITAKQFRMLLPIIVLSRRCCKRPSQSKTELGERQPHIISLPSIEECLKLLA